MTATDAPTTPYRLSERQQRTVTHRWEWNDLTDDELRCLWVIEQWLAESGHQLRHCDGTATPRRHPGPEARFTFPVFGGTIETFDAGGLASLTIASFYARVRTEVQTRTLYYDAADEDPSWFWTEEEVEADWERRATENKGGAWWGICNKCDDGVTHRFPTYEEMRDWVDGHHNKFGVFDGAYGAYGSDDEPDIHPQNHLCVTVTGRSTTGQHPMIDWHPDIGYLTDLITTIGATP